MLAHYESRLADVLGTRITAPFTGRVFVAPGPADDDSALLIAVRDAEVVAEDFGSRRPEIVPGDGDRRRVVRLRCRVWVEVRPAAGADRAERVAALDAALYALDAPELRDASALAAPAGDPGFAIRSQRARLVAVEPDDAARPSTIELDSDGWFWPPDAPGEDGGPIKEAFARLTMLPIAVSPSRPRAKAGGPVLDLELHLDLTGIHVDDEGEDGPAPLGRLALRLVDAGGRPGAGTLTGGDAGPQDSRVVAAAATVRIGYQPPAARAVDHLVVAILREITDAPDEIGVILADVEIRVVP